MKKICDSTIDFVDYWGENKYTFHCQLEEGHIGNHQEEGCVYDNQSYKYCIYWADDMREELTKYICKAYGVPAEFINAS